MFNVTTVRKEVNPVETWSDLWVGNGTMLPSYNLIDVDHNSKYSVKHLYNWVPLRTEAEGKCKIATKSQGANMSVVALSESKLSTLSTLANTPPFLTTSPGLAIYYTIPS